MFSHDFSPIERVPKFQITEIKEEHYSVNSMFKAELLYLNKIEK